MAYRAFTFSEFRSQTLCVDYIRLEMDKTELYISTFKFFVATIPQFTV